MKRLSQREYLWRKDNHCYWCRRPTRLVTPADHESMPDDATTIDHLFSKFDERRQERNLGIIRRNRRGELKVVRKVIACYACNQARSKIECKLSKSDAHTIATGEDSPVPGNKIGHKPLHCQPYGERRYRLKRFKDRVEQGLDGLIEVMGLPLTSYMSDFQTLATKPKAAREELIDSVHALVESYSNKSEAVEIDFCDMEPIDEKISTNTPAHHKMHNSIRTVIYSATAFAIGYAVARIKNIIQRNRKK